MANERHKLVEFALSGLTLRLADEGLALDDDTYYNGWLKSISSLRRSVGRLLDPQYVSPRMRLTFDNSGDQMRSLVDSYEFANKSVTCKVQTSGDGTQAADYETYYVGTVDFPSGIEWDEAELSVYLSDIVSAGSRVLPVNKIFPSSYPNALAVHYYYPIPLIYGSWLTTDGGGEAVPCYCIDTTEGNGGRWKIADHALKQIEDVYEDGVSANFTADLADGEFVLDDAYGGGTITANVQGATDDGTSTGTLLQSLPEIMDDLLQTHLAVDSGDINATAFTNWEAELTANDYGRRWIGTEVSSNTLISEMLVDGFADLAIIDGKYYPIYRIVSLAADIPTYYDFDIRDVGDVKDFRVVRDEERVYANQIVADYRYDPVSLAHTVRYDTEDAAAIAAVGARKRRRLTMNWLYLSAGAQSRADREKYVFANELETVAVGLTQRALTKNPTDQFRLIYSKFDLGGNVGTPFQIREIQTDAFSVTAKAKAWNMMMLSPGRWGVATHPTWLSSGAWQRQVAGYWTDTSGYADPSVTPDEASKRSIWF